MNRKSYANTNWIRNGNSEHFFETIAETFRSIDRVYSHGFPKKRISIFVCGNLLLITFRYEVVDIPEGKYLDYEKNRTLYDFFLFTVQQYRYGRRWFGMSGRFCLGFWRSRPRGGPVSHQIPHKNTQRILFRRQA